MKINPEIFKAYDIRGKVPGELNEEIAEKVAYATAVFLSGKYKKKKLKFFICRDVRLSSPKLAQAVMKGILAQGSDVVDLGEGTTPYFYYLMATKSVDGGIMVTASHNPPEYNGLKIRGKGSKAVSLGTGLEHIKDLVLDETDDKKNNEHGEVLPPEDHSKEYIDFLAQQVKISRPLKIAVDASGGSTALFLSGLLSRFPNISYKPLFFEVDGSFGRHVPNPLAEESQVHVKKELEAGGYDFGVIFDGDGDRVVFFDETGKKIHPNYILALFAKKILKKKSGQSFVLSVNASRGVREFLEEQEGNVKLSAVGYVFMQKAMKDARALYGVELSGHFYFKDFFYDDSALLAFLKLAEALSEEEEPLSRLVGPFDRYISSGEINFPVKNKESINARFMTHFQNSKLKFLDGVSGEFSDWWFNIRPSNTEPLVRLVLEAKNEKLFEEKMAEIKSLISA